MDSTSESISLAVAVLTAVISDQEDIAYEMVLDSDPIELFSGLTGITLGALNHLSEINGTTIDVYLKDLGMMATRTE